MNEIGVFNKFVNPFVKIDSKASAVNGLSQDFVENYDGWDVTGVSFNEWIETLREGCPVTLVAHNGKRHVFLFLFVCLFVCLVF